MTAREKVREKFDSLLRHCFSEFGICHSQIFSHFLLGFFQIPSSGVLHSLTNGCDQHRNNVVKVFAVGFDTNLYFVLKYDGSRLKKVKDRRSEDKNVREEGKNEERERKP